MGNWKTYIEDDLSDVGAPFGLRVVRRRLECYLVLEGLTDGTLNTNTHAVNQVAALRMGMHTPIIQLNWRICGQVLRVMHITIWLLPKSPKESPPPHPPPGPAEGAGEDRQSDFIL